MELKEFIERVKRKNCRIDAVEAFMLVDLYTEYYGELYTELSIEDELVYMWEKLKDIKDGNKLNDSKRCVRCKSNLALSDFSIDRQKADGRNVYCRSCCKKIRDAIKNPSLRKSNIKL